MKYFKIIGLVFLYFTTLYFSIVSLNKRSLNFEMADMEAKQFDILLIDVFSGKSAVFFIVLYSIFMVFVLMSILKSKVFSKIYLAIFSVFSISLLMITNQAFEVPEEIREEGTYQRQNGTMGRGFALTI